MDYKTSQIQSIAPSIINVEMNNVNPNKDISRDTISNDTEGVSFRGIRNSFTGSIASQISTDVTKIFGNEDNNYDNASVLSDTEITKTTDYTSTSSYSKFNGSLTAKHPKSIFKILEDDAEFEPGALIKKFMESNLEEEEPDNVFEYLKDFSCADAIGAPTLALLERKANEDELHKLCEQQAQNRQKYVLLNKKISEYYRKKKVDRVFTDIAPELYNQFIEKYDRKVDEFLDVYNAWIREKSLTDHEINGLITFKIDQETQLKKNIKSLTAKEKEIGNFLLENGEVQEKVVERLINRQKTKSGKMAIIRTAYIKQRDKVKSIELRIKELESIGGSFHLMDFEQLRMENTIYSDKIEERDEELMRLRGRFSHAIQALAHVREKSNVMEVQIEDLKEENIKSEEIMSEIRESLNNLKIERDNNRALTHKHKIDSGLLNYPSLLIDMECSLKIADVYKQDMEKSQAMYKKNRNKLKGIRNFIEQIGEKTNINFVINQSQQITAVVPEQKTQFDHIATVMKTKIDQVFVDKSCCPHIPKTTITEIIEPTIKKKNNKEVK